MRLMERPSPQLLNGLLSGRFARFIVILFLFYAGVDITNPQLCNEEFGPAPVLLARNAETQAEAPSPETAIQRSEKQREQPSAPEGDDEDCFCCCTHVLPAPTTHPNGASDVVLLEHISMPQSVSTAHLNALYHPPRAI